MDWEPRVGMKVVCVDDAYGRIDPDDPAFYETRPIRGQVYRIREIHRGPDGVSLRVEEIINQPIFYTDGFFECSFLVRRFKPLRERKSDISCFTAMLVNPPKELAYTVPNRPFE